jgi:hypothetical protein
MSQSDLMSLIAGQIINSHLNKLAHANQQGGISYILTCNIEKEFKVFLF